MFGDATKALDQLKRVASFAENVEMQSNLMSKLQSAMSTISGNMRGYFGVACRIRGNVKWP